jgi:predicted MFS family arabinose efflux permease
MGDPIPTTTGRRPGIFYGWYIVGLTFFVLLAVSGIRSASAVIIKPVSDDMHWTIAQISIAVATNVVLFGAMGPFAAALMQRYGVKRSMITALAIMAASTALASRIETPFELWLTWGLGVGLGVGMLSMVLASFVATRWFVKNRGLVQGLMMSGNASGQLIFLPSLAFVASHVGWRPVGLIVAGVALLVMIPIALFMRNRPEDLGLRAYGTPADAPAVATHAGNPLDRAFGVLKRGLKNRDCLLVGGTFFVCGASTNGFIGTHFIPACSDHGIPEVAAASMLAVMGACSFVGTTASGWLSDRYPSNLLLSIYYGSRALSLFLIAFALDAGNLWIVPYFMIFYGLDWLTTGAPNLRALAEALGPEDAPIAYGWVGVAHAVGAGMTALVAGAIRTGTGSYTDAFGFSAILCVIATMMALGIGGQRRRLRRLESLTT